MGKYYDKSDNIEFREINQCMSNSENSKVWQQKRVLEIGCGSSRFTEKYITEASSVVAIDPDKDRIEIFNTKLRKKNNNNHCQLFTGTLSELILIPDNKKYFDRPFDIIIFPWSWAYIDNQIETFKIVLELLAASGILVFTMVVGGEFEEVVIHSNLKDSSRTTHQKSNDLIRNSDSLLLLNNLIYDTGYHKEEALIETAFNSPDIKVASQYILSLVNHENNRQVLTDLISYKKNDGTIYMTDIVKCVVIQNLDNS